MKHKTLEKNTRNKWCRFLTTVHHRDKTLSRTGSTFPLYLGDNACISWPADQLIGLKVFEMPT